jgi:hypothetical protein
MQIEFPRRLLREKSHSWNLAGTAATPGQTSKSVAPFVRTDGGGFWTCVMSDVSLSGAPGLVGRDRQKISTLLWRAIQNIADGGVTPIVVPRNDAMFRPWPAGISPTGAIDLAHSDGAFFSDGAGFYQPTIDITADAADLRATSLDITVNYAGELMGGESFSIDHLTMGWRMYYIGTVFMDDATSSGTINILPPLREAIAPGTRLEFDRPRCTMRLAKPDSMDLTVVPWTFNSASVDFVEAFPDEL